MLKLIGALLLTCGAAGLGFGAAGHLSRRVRSLRSLLGALELMEREIAFRLTPVPELLELLARRSDGPAAAFFSDCLDALDSLGERSLSQIWRDALAGRPMDLAQDDQRTLGELGEILGRYDGPGQREALGEIRSRLLHNLACAEEENGRMGRVYGALGLTAGCFLAILLL